MNAAWKSSVHSRAFGRIHYRGNSKHPVDLQQTDRCRETFVAKASLTHRLDWPFIGVSSEICSIRDSNRQLAVAISKTVFNLQIVSSPHFGKMVHKYLKIRLLLFLLFQVSIESKNTNAGEGGLISVS